ncbi:MAG: hypothetical protein ACREHC_08240 [Candidatus Levyibacteriota bacterium]
MQQGTAVVSPELSTFIANSIATVVFYGDLILIAGIVFSAIRILLAGDDVDLKTHMKALLTKLVVGAFLLSAAYPLGNWLLQLAGKHS